MGATQELITSFDRYDATVAVALVTPENGTIRDPVVSTTPRSTQPLVGRSRAVQSRAAPRGSVRTTGSLITSRSLRSSAKPRCLAAAEENTPSPPRDGWRLICGDWRLTKLRRTNSG